MPRSATPLTRGLEKGAEVRAGVSLMKNALGYSQSRRGHALMQPCRYLSWDDYFMAVAFLSAQRSKDPNKQVDPQATSACASAYYLVPGSWVRVALC